MAYGKGDGEGGRSLLDSLLGRDGETGGSVDDGVTPGEADDERDGTPVEGETEFAGSDGPPEEWEDEGGGHWWETITDVWRETSSHALHDDDDDEVAVADDEPKDAGEAPPADDGAGGTTADPDTNATAGHVERDDGDAPEGTPDEDPGETRDASDAPDSLSDGTGSDSDAHAPSESQDDEPGSSGFSPADGKEPGAGAGEPSPGRDPGGDESEQGERPSPQRRAEPMPRPRRHPGSGSDAWHAPVPDPRLRPPGAVSGQRPRMSPQPVFSSGAVRDATHSFGSRANDVLLPNARSPVPAGSVTDRGAASKGSLWKRVAVVAVAVLAGFAIGVVSHVELPTDKVSVMLGDPVASESIGEDGLDADAATLSYAGKAVRVSLRQAIETRRPLSEARLEDGSYEAPSAEDVLAAVRGEIILANAAERGITEDDAVSAWVSSRYGLSSVADLAREMGVPEEEALRQVRGPAVAQALMEKVVGSGFSPPPPAPYEPASGNRSERVARYATYVNNIEDESAGVVDATLDGYAYDGSTASYDMAVVVYEEAMSRWEDRQDRLAARWDTYLSALLSSADVHIRTCSVTVDSDADGTAAPDHATDGSSSREA